MTSQSPFRLLGLLTLFSSLTHAQETAKAPADPDADAVQLDRFVVTSAGQFSTGNLPSAVLTPIEILMVPGGAADINRALQTLPGVQLADEGNALFVRGGDSIETATWINGIRFPSNVRINAPLGGVSGTISPWQAKSVDFAAGGFGAQTGNALSGAVKITTFGAPHEFGAALNLGAGNVAASIDLPITSTFGLRANANREYLGMFLDLYGSTRPFDRPPQGETYSLAGSWDYRPDGKIRWYAFSQSNVLSLPVRNSGHDDVFGTTSLTRFYAVSWEDRLGAWQHELNLGGGQLDRDERLSAQSWTTHLAHQQFSYRSTYDAGKLLWRLGADGSHEKQGFTQQFPLDPGPPFTTVSHTEERALAVWGEMDTVFARHFRFVGGLRANTSRLAHQRTLDPRLSLTWQPRPALTFSLSGGRYHQTPSETYYDSRLTAWPLMQSDQAIASIEWRNHSRLLRAETYVKRYQQLVSLDRNYRPRGHATGSARGLDLLYKTPLPADIRGRLTWSMVEAERTDPNTGQLAPAPWAVRHSITAICEHTFGSWEIALAGRWASGRPYTPIIGSTASGTGLVPVYGPSYSQHYPTFQRFDCTLVRLWEINRRWQAATYFAAFNLLGRKNVSDYDYSDDFTQRRPVPGIFGLSLYFGVNLTFR